MQKRSRVKKRYVTPKECPFCVKEASPSYKDYKTLMAYLTARSAITPKKYSGVCSTHQRLLGREIKHARQLGLLPFLPTA